MSERTANILGVGNILMRDDGAGPAAVAAIVERGAPEGVGVWDAGLAAADVMGTLDPAVPLVVIDAVRGGGEPGSIYRIDLDGDAALRETSGAMLSLHEVSVLPALRMEALSGRRFAKVVVFGVEPEVVQWGEGLSARVSAALEGLVEEVFRHLKASGSCMPAAKATGERDS